MNEFSGGFNIMNKLRNLFLLTVAVFMIPAVGLADEPNTQSLEKQIRKEILTLPYYGVFDIIGFEIKDDTVVLSGKVFNGINRKNAERRVSRIDGVNKVVNNIELLPPSSFDDRIRANTYRALSNSGGVYRYLLGPNPSVRIIVDGGNLTLEGSVATEGDIRLMNIIGQGVPGVFTFTNNLIISSDTKY